MIYSEHVETKEITVKLPKIIKRSFRNTTCSRVLTEDFTPPCDINFKYAIENDGG